MNQRQPPVSKTQVGIIAGICLVTALGIKIFSPGHDLILSAFLRVGVVMAALWWAVPKKGASVAWNKMMPVLIGGIVLIVLSKKLIIVALPAAIVVGTVAYYLRPRTKHRSNRSDR